MRRQFSAASEELEEQVKRGKSLHAVFRTHNERYKVFHHYKYGKWDSYGVRISAGEPVSRAKPRPSCTPVRRVRTERYWTHRRIRTLVPSGENCYTRVLRREGLSASSHLLWFGATVSLLSTETTQAGLSFQRGRRTGTSPPPAVRRARVRVSVRLPCVLTGSKDPVPGLRLTTETAGLEAEDPDTETS